VSGKRQKSQMELALVKGEEVKPPRLYTKGPSRPRRSMGPKARRQLRG
jgi:hypothetical protein